MEAFYESVRAILNARNEDEVNDALATHGSDEHLRDIAALVLENLQLRAECDKLSGVDAGTGLPNRRVFEERLESELQRSARSRRSFALAIFRVDPADGETLQAAAASLRAHARHVDFVARYGDAEFAAILVEVDGGVAQAILDRIIAAVAAADASIRPSAWAGAALSFPVDTVESILERADAALYEAKQAAQNTAIFR